MTYELFNRVPNCCGVWKKLKPVNTDRWLRTLLNAYLDEETKTRPMGWKQAEPDTPKAERHALIAEGMAPMSPGVDYVPFQFGLWVFGHLATRLSEHGSTPTFAQPKEVVERLGQWWIHDRRDAAIKAHHVTASFDPRIAEELRRRGYPVDAMLLATFHNAVSQYGARYYPEAALGWMAGCHHDRAHPHIHALLHPTTADGKLIRVSGLKDDEPGEDKFEFLRTSFNTRARQLFVSLTHARKVSPDQQRVAARQFALLTRYAMLQGDLQGPKAPYAAAELLAQWLSNRDYTDLLVEASKATNQEFFLKAPAAVQPDGVRKTWTRVRDDWHGKRTRHLDVATAAFRSITEARNSPDAFRYIVGPYGAPSRPTESEYFALAANNAKAPIDTLPDALAARRAESERIRGTINPTLEAYRAALETSRRDLDALVVQSGFLAGHVEVLASRIFGGKLGLTDVVAAPGTPILRSLSNPVRVEATGEREMATIAAKEAAAHRPEDTAAAPALLASPRSPHFRELMAPSVQLPDLGPTIH